MAEFSGLDTSSLPGRNLTPVRKRCLLHPMRITFGDTLLLFFFFECSQFALTAVRNAWRFLFCPAQLRQPDSSTFPGWVVSIMGSVEGQGDCCFKYRSTSTRVWSRSGKTPSVFGETDIELLLVRTGDTVVRRRWTRLGDSLVFTSVQPVDKVDLSFFWETCCLACCVLEVCLQFEFTHFAVTSLEEGKGAEQVALKCGDDGLTGFRNEGSRDKET